MCELMHLRVRVGVRECVWECVWVCVSACVRVWVGVQWSIGKFFIVISQRSPKKKKIAVVFLFGQIT